MTFNSLNTLHFPQSHSVGWVKIPKDGPDSHNNWVEIGEAVGKVAVPISTPIRLIVEPSSALDLAWLELIGPAQLAELYLVQTQVTDESLQHVSHLTGLEVLTLSHTYENISDSGAIHLKPLVNLRNLHLNATNIGDIGLSYLSGMHKLEALSIGATKITDEGLAQLHGLHALKKISFTTHYAGTRINHISSSGVEQLKRALPSCTIEL